MDEEQQTETPVVNPNQDFLNLLNQLPGAPTPDEIERWKQKWGDVFVFAFSDKEVFLFRALTRAEYKDLQVKTQLEVMKAQRRNEKLNNPEEEPDWTKVETNLQQDMTAGFAQDEEVVVKCVLWPKVTSEELSKKAGTVPGLHEAILMNSNFVSPAQASQLVMRL